MNRRPCGMTLLEVLVALAVAALALGAAAAYLPQALGGFEARALAQEVHTVLTTARRDALRSGAPVTVHYRPDERLLLRDDEPLLALPPQAQLQWFEAREMRPGEPGVVFWPGGGSTGARCVLHYRDRRFSWKVDWLLGEIARQPAASAPSF